MMSAPGTMLEFDGWSKSSRYLIVIYADFEALILKIEEKKGEKTTAIQKHKSMICVPLAQIYPIPNIVK
jgi:hypothetical protein